MRRLWQFLTDSRVAGLIGVAALAAFLLLGADTLQTGLVWTAVAGGALLVGWGLFWVLRRQVRQRANAHPGVSVANGEAIAAAALRKSMLEAITTIKTSKLGLVSGAAALYELPWYLIIGNPGAGKSSAVGHSGLQFPIAAGKAAHGAGGARDCDWSFTTGGILLDTTGRYAIDGGDRAGWFTFLDLLRRYRRRAPVNGVILAVSVAELTGENAGKAVELAKGLRTRVQELTERLGVYAPVYVLFTKADLIAGFADFFRDASRTDRERIWGATARYNRRSTPQDVLGFFDEQFDALHEGLKELSLAGMAGSRDAAMPPGVFTFPPEFASIKSPLRAFLATLFEENTYQFKPVFRGFYFSSALQEGAVAQPASEKVASRFDLALREPAGGPPEAAAGEDGGYFLLDLFRKVIFADRDLVARYTSPATLRLKAGVFFAGTILLGCALGAWTWSAIGNRQLVANVKADFEQVVRLQDKRTDLQSRLEALEILQDRIVQLERYRRSRPLMLSFGLYQGDRLERKLRDEYFSGMREVMVQPVAAGLEALLAEMNASPDKLDAAPPRGAPAARPGQAYQEASPFVVADAHAALKAYLMLGDKNHAEPSHLNDQITRYWRGWLEAHRGAMPREQMIRVAERLLTFHLSQVGDPAWPQVALKLGLLDSARENLRRVVTGTPALKRVYDDIKSRASTRFPAVTVAGIVGEQDQGLIGGSHAVPGAFTREAWDKFVLGAIREASNKELQSTDWVLKTVARNDLTLEGSPEQIQKTLAGMYKAEYAQQWLTFVQGVTVAELAGFDASVQAMNRIGDPQTSPVAKLLQAIHQQTAWDNPAAGGAAMGKAERGLADWFKETILRRAPSQARVVVDAATAPGAPPAMGPIGREFAGVARLVGAKEKDASLMTGYLDCLSRLRTRLNQLKNQGDPGPGARQFMQQTLEGSGSELAEALKFVDEQMLTGMSDAQKLALRPILVRPLVQTFAMIVLPSEAEINKTWQVQVVEPFKKTLAPKYPFAPGSRMEATSAEIGQFFGPEGAVARFVGTSMGPLVVRRGDVLAARTWAGMGIALAPEAVAGFPGWVAPLGAGGVAHSAGPQTVFQLRALPAPGTTEYTIEIDGQQLRYRNTPPVWTNMVHPGPQGTPGARISAVTFDGRTVELFNEPGQFGLTRMFGAATRTRKGGGVFELRWASGKVAIAVDLKITSSASRGAGSPQGNVFHGLRLPEAIVGRAAQAPRAVAAIGSAGGQ